MKKGVIIFWSILVVTAGARLIFSFYQRRPDIGPCLKSVVSGIGNISQDPELKDTGQVLTISIEDMHIDTAGIVGAVGIVGEAKCPDDLNIRAKAKLYPRFVYGDKVNFSGKLTAPFDFRGDDGRSFDYRGYLAKDDVYYEIKSANVTTVSTSSKGISISSILFSIKRGFVANLGRVLGEPYAALASGLAVGDKTSLGPQLLQDFRNVGLIHIVVLSGFSMAIIVDALRRSLSFLPRVASIIVGMVTIILFAISVGAGVTVVRACSMASLALFADLSRRDYNVVRALIFVGLIMLIQNPLILLHDPAFDITFAATSGLILLGPSIRKRLGWIPEKFDLRGAVAATLATQIFVSPLTVYMMGQFSLIGVFANILVLPFIPLTMLAIFLTGVTGFLPTIFMAPILAIISRVFGWGAHLLLAYELFIVQNCARVPFASLHVPQFSGWFVVAFYAIFVGVYWYRRTGSS